MFAEAGIQGTHKGAEEVHGRHTGQLVSSVDGWLGTTIVTIFKMNSSSRSEKTTRPGVGRLLQPFPTYVDIPQMHGTLFAGREGAGRTVEKPGPRGDHGFQVGTRAAGLRRRGKRKYQLPTTKE